ncbi:hypothetical protein LIER_16112 [Lithospermum erythrorhizon]|uniref:Uncharacterized protein n=1 Tax=Lithospermum erythrorhizon TaxID=34254 RepID=A0AAV3Q7U7_LITER
MQLRIPVNKGIKGVLTNFFRGPGQSYSPPSASPITPPMACLFLLLGPIRPSPYPSNWTSSSAIHSRSPDPNPYTPLALSRASLVGYQSHNSSHTHNAN